MVKGSGGVGMWSTCKVVHHVHAVGALVHQAAQARSLCSWGIGGYVELGGCPARLTQAERGGLAGRSPARFIP